jgi:hypothetical protein
MDGVEGGKERGEDKRKNILILRRYAAVAISHLCYMLKLYLTGLPYLILSPGPGIRRGLRRAHCLRATPSFRALRWIAKLVTFGKNK